MHHASRITHHASRKNTDCSVALLLRSCFLVLVAFLAYANVAQSQDCPNPLNFVLTKIDNDLPEYKVSVMIPSGPLAVRLFRVDVNLSGNVTAISNVTVLNPGLPTAQPNGSLTMITMFNGSTSNIYNFSGPLFDLFSFSFSADPDECIDLSMTMFAFEADGNEDGNFSLCTPVAGSGDTHCFPPIPTNFVSGLIESVPPQQCFGTFNHGIEQVRVSVLDANNEGCLAITDDHGDYTCEVNSGGDYTIDPQKEDNFECGVTTADRILLRKHHTGGCTESLTNWRELFAADITGDFVISNADDLIIGKIISGVPFDASIYESWRFFATADYYSLLPPSSCLLQLPTTLREQYSITNLQTDISGFEFTGIKGGDINASCTDCNGEYLQNEPSEENKALFTNADAINLGTPIASLVPGEQRTIPIYWQQTTSMLAVNLGLQLNREKLRLVDVIYNEELQQVAEDFYFSPEKGFVRCNWITADINVRTMTVGEPLFWLVVEAHAAVENVATHIRLEGTQMEDRVYWNEDITHPLQWQADWKVPEERLPYPNPFQQQVQFSIDLPTAGSVEIEVFTTDGQRIHNHRTLAPAGPFFTTWHPEAGLPAGVYYYRIHTDRQVMEGKLVKQ